MFHKFYQTRGRVCASRYLNTEKKKAQSCAESHNLAKKKRKEKKRNYQLYFQRLMTVLHFRYTL